MNTGTRLLVLALVTLGITACNRTLDPVPPHLYEVYPTHVGQERIFHVIDTTYNTAAGELGLEYYKREVTSGYEEDLLGRTVTRQDLYSSPYVQDSLGNPLYDWDYLALWTLYKDDNYAERTEGNDRILTLKIPSVEGSSWNGNLYNANGLQTYRVISEDTTVVVAGVTYAHCVWVQELEKRRDGDGVTFLVDEYAYEVYAPGIGKILKYYKHYEKQSNLVDENSRVIYEELVYRN